MKDSSENWLAADITAEVRRTASVFGSRNRQEFRRLHDMVSRAAPQQVFFGLMNVFLEKEFEAQQLSGRLLMGLQPKLQQPLDQIIRPVLESWNVSVEELPFYLARKAGMTQLLATLSSLESEPLSDSGTQAVKTFRYWLRQHSAQLTVQSDAAAPRRLT